MRACRRRTWEKFAVLFYSQMFTHAECVSRYYASESAAENRVGFTSLRTVWLWRTTFDISRQRFGLPGSEVINITRRENHCSSFNGITYCGERSLLPYDKRVNAMRRNSFVLIMATAWITKHRRFCETWPVKVKLTKLIRFSIINFTNWSVLLPAT